MVTSVSASMDGGIRGTREARSLGCKTNKERTLQGAPFLVLKTALRWRSRGRLSDASARTSQLSPNRRCSPWRQSVPSGDGGLVKEVADTDHASGFAREVDRKPCGGAAEGAGDGIQFPPSTLQIRPRHGEVYGVQARDRREQSPVLRVPSQEWRSYTQHFVFQEPRKMPRLRSRFSLQHRPRHGSRELQSPQAVAWIAARWEVPMLPKHSKLRRPERWNSGRVGVANCSIVEDLGRVGFWASLDDAGRAVLMALICFTDPMTGEATISTRGNSAWSYPYSTANAVMLPARLAVETTRHL